MQRASDIAQRKDFGFQPREWMIGAILVLVALVAYWRSFSSPFIFDDLPAITENASIRHLGDWRAVWSPPPGGSGVAGRPVVNFSLAADYALWGENARGFHVANFCYHALAGLVLFGLLRRTLMRLVWPARVQTAAPWLAGISTLLWLVHPLQTESVTCIVQRTEVLVSLFYLFVLYGTVRSAEPGAGRGWPIATVAASVLGMATKEVMVTAPIVLLLFDRTVLAGTFRDAWSQRARLHGGVMASWLVLVLILWTTGGTRGAVAGFGLGVAWWSYALTQCDAVVRYLGLAFWPRPLVLHYGSNLIAKPAEVLPQAWLLAALAGASFWAVWRRPGLGFAGAMFFIVLAPSSSVVPLVTQTMAEHRIYLPLAAVIATLVVGAYTCVGRRGAWAGAGLALAFAALTAARNWDYRSEVDIWRDTAAKRPENAVAHVNFGFALARAGRATEAAAQFETALKINPRYAEAHGNLANVLLRAGRLTEAIEEYRIALRLKPDFASAYSGLGYALSEAGQDAAALENLATALRLDPDFADAHQNFAFVLTKTGRFVEAVEHCQAALRLKPDFADAHNTLGIAFVRLGRMAEARKEFETAIRLQDLPTAKQNLAQLKAHLEQQRGKK